MKISNLYAIRQNRAHMARRVICYRKFTWRSLLQTHNSMFFWKHRSGVTCHLSNFMPIKLFENLTMRISLLVVDITNWFRWTYLMFFAHSSMVTSFCIVWNLIRECLCVTKLWQQKESHPLKISIWNGISIWIYINL